MGKGDKKTRRGKVFRGSYGNSRRRRKKKKHHSSHNKLCYVSKTRLTKKNMTLEHVIPNALGGRLKSSWLMTKEWNENFGMTIDKSLIEQIPLSTLISIKRDRYDSPKIVAYSENGGKFLVGADKNITRLPSKPEKIQTEEGTIIKFIKGQEEQILNSIKRKNPSIDTYKLREQIKWSSSGDEIALYFKNPLTAVSGKDAFKSICKIVTNFYVFSTNEINQIQCVVPFIKGESEWLNRIKYFYPTDYMIHELGSDEISHVIYIKGAKKEKLLYGYLELFSCYCFLIILNDNYTGDDVEYTYCFDLSRQKELMKKMNLNLSKSDIQKMDFPQDKNTEDEFFKRIDRVFEIKGIQGTRRQKPAANNGS